MDGRRGEIFRNIFRIENVPPLVQALFVENLQFLVFSFWSSVISSRSTGGIEAIQKNFGPGSSRRQARQDRAWSATYFGTGIDLIASGLAPAVRAIGDTAFLAGAAWLSMIATLSALFSVMETRSPVAGAGLRGGRAMSQAPTAPAAAAGSGRLKPAPT